MTLLGTTMADEQEQDLFIRAIYNSFLWDSDDLLAVQRLRFSILRAFWDNGNIFKNPWAMIEFIGGIECLSKDDCYIFQLVALSMIPDETWRQIAVIALRKQPLIPGDNIENPRYHPVEVDFDSHMALIKVLHITHHIGRFANTSTIRNRLYARLERLVREVQRFYPDQLDDNLAIDAVDSICQLYNLPINWQRARHLVMTPSSSIYAADMALKNRVLGMLGSAQKRLCFRELTEIIKTLVPLKLHLEAVIIILYFAVGSFDLEVVTRLDVTNIHNRVLARYLRSSARSVRPRLEQ